MLCAHSVATAAAGSGASERSAAGGVGWSVRRDCAAAAPDRQVRACVCTALRSHVPYFVARGH